MVRRMLGVSSYIETIKPKEYLKNDTCKMFYKGNCLYRKGAKCTGATYCIMYIEDDYSITDEEKRKKMESFKYSFERKKAKEKNKKRELKTKTSQRKLKLKYPELIPGKEIIHKKFGYGIIVTNDWNIIKIAFSNTVKKFKLSFLTENNIIKIL